MALADRNMTDTELTAPSDAARRATAAGLRVPTNARRRRGSTTIEFAILLPLLMTIALVCVDYGRFVHWYIAVTNAARTGAGWGANHPTTDTAKPIWDLGVRQAIENELANNGWFDATELTVPEPELIDEGNGLRRVRVEVRYPFETLITWPFLPGYNDPVTLKKVVVMRLVR